jgi:hypothetical protein
VRHPRRRKRQARFAEQTFRDAFQAGSTLEDMDAYCGIAFAEPFFRRRLQGLVDQS